MTNKVETSLKDNPVIPMENSTQTYSTFNDSKMISKHIDNVSIIVVSFQHLLDLLHNLQVLESYLIKSIVSNHILSWKEKSKDPIGSFPKLLRNTVKQR